MRQCVRTLYYALVMKTLLFLYTNDLSGNFLSQ